MRCQEAPEESLSGGVVIWGRFDLPSNISLWLLVLLLYVDTTHFPQSICLLCLFSGLAWLFCQALHQGEAPHAQRYLCVAPSQPCMLGQEDTQ